MLRCLGVAGGQSESFAHRAVIPAKAGTSTCRLAGGPRFRGDDRPRGDDSGYRARWPGDAA